MEDNLSYVQPAVTPSWVLPEPSLYPGAVPSWGVDCTAGSPSVWAEGLLCAAPTSDQGCHQPGQIGCPLPIMALEEVSPWTPNCQDQGRGHKPWLPLFTLQLRQ